jgi:hypothetical protein
MAGFQTQTDQGHLIIGNHYSRMIRELLVDDLFALRWVKQITEFPDGTTFNIPSLGESETANYVEGQAVKYNKMDTGNFTFSFDTYKYSANSISEKFKRDSFWSSDVVAAFVPRQHRALMEAVETDILSCVNKSTGQTASNPNQINGADHRWIGSGTNETLSVLDTALVAVLDPTASYALQTQTNAVNLLSPMPMYQDINTNGLVTGYRFRFNFAGFDCYESNYLPKNIAETISATNGSRSSTVGVANQFFSATPGDTLPIIGGFRQQPTVYTEFNKDLQQDEFLTIAEWGYKLYRPENMICVITDTDQV